MDAKERLRRYLEQRREVGESELVLDAMSVDEVMAMLGAKRGAIATGSVRKNAAPRDDAEEQRSIATAAPPEVSLPVVVEPTVRFEVTEGADWRTALGGLTPPPSAAPPNASSSHHPPTVAANAGESPLATTALPAWLQLLGLPSGIHVVSAPTAQDHHGALSSLAHVADAAHACTRCALHATAKNVVPGEGNPTADLVCVGEAPGANEDEQGRPFVGDAGGLLTKILAAIHLQRDDVFICNVLKHRPPMNRDPLPDEVQACQPFLERQLQLIRPRVILALGRFAAQTLLHTTTPISKLRGQVHSFHGVPLIVTYHPAALLRNEAWKRPTWDDVKLARRILDASHDADRDALSGSDAG